MKQHLAGMSGVDVRTWWCRGGCGLSRWSFQLRECQVNGWSWLLRWS